MRSCSDEVLVSVGAVWSTTRLLTLTLSSTRVSIPFLNMLNQMLSRSTFEIFTAQEK